MWIFPLMAALVAVAFAASLIRRFVARRRAYNLVWAIALLLYAGASVAMALGVLNGWTPFDFRMYWLLGAVLNVPYLALGELYLLSKNRWVNDAALVVLVFATAFALAKVRGAQVDAAALAKQLPRGELALGKGSAAWRLAQYYSYPTYTFLVLGTLWSALRMRRSPNLRDQFFGTLFIAVGATIVAAGAAFAATGIAWGFSMTLAVGIAVMFAGFLRSSRSRPVPETPTAADPATQA